MHVVETVPVKVRFSDLKRLGLVRNRFDLHQKIKQGKLPPPHKDGQSMQSSAWWWGADIVADLERERAERQQQK
jgi:hypothetical protein